MPKAKKQDRITHLSRVVFEGYKSIDHLEIDLVKGLNILIGKNGSGKSNFLGLVESSLNWFPPVNSVSPYEYFNSSEITMVTANNQKLKWYSERRGIYRGIAIKDIFSDASEKGIYNGKSKLSIGNANVYDSERIQNFIFENKNGGINIIPPKHIIDVLQEMKISKPSLIFVKYNLPTTNLLIAVSTPGEITFDKKNSSYHQTESDLAVIGEVFLNFIFNYFLGKPLQNINLNREEIISKLVVPDSVKTNLRKFSPVQDIRFSPNINIYEDENRASIENIILEFYVNDTWIPWSYLSDGTKRLFYLISEISFFDDAIILIEEPELGVHPDQFHLIMNFLKEQAEDKQIIMSTHSPEALNVLNDDELQNIIVTKYDKKKGTTMSHLNKPQIAKAKAYMKELDLSDYWLQSDLEG